MYKCALLVKMTDDYWKALAENPGSDRQAAVKTAYESVGGKLLFFGFIHGKWDVLLVAEAPSEKEFWAPIAQAMFGGMIKDMESFPIIEQETITGAMGMAQQAGYKAPGQ